MAEDSRAPITRVSRTPPGADRCEDDLADFCRVSYPRLIRWLMPFAPGATLLNRFPAQVVGVFTALRLDGEFIAREFEEMREQRLAKTNDRSVLGVMNGLTHLVDQYHASNGVSDPLHLSLLLAGTPCGPLFGGNVSPDRELAEFVARRS